MSSKGVKRGSPGADSEKNPLGDVDLSDQEAIKLQAIQKDIARVELALGTSQSILPLFNHPATPAPPPPSLPSFLVCLSCMEMELKAYFYLGRAASVLQSAARRKRCCPCTRSGARS